MMSELWLTFTRWFDSQSGLSNLGEEESKEIDWFRCLPFFMLHFACFSVILVGYSALSLSLAGVLYLVRMFAITGFYHRYFSHRSFKTSRFIQFIFALIGASSVQRGPLWWAAHHRHHHRYSDTQEDVHSPEQSGFLWSHMLWFTCRYHFRTRNELIEDFNKYPELRWLDRFDILIPVILGSLVFIAGEIINSFYPEMGTSGPQLLVWGLISTVILFHATFSTNSLAHLFGGKRYETGDGSRNNLLVAILTLGEGWHNNHHHYPSSVQQGFHWWEVDITYWILAIMSKLGLVWDLKMVPEKAKSSALI